MDRYRVGSFSNVPIRPTTYTRADRTVTRPPVLTQSGYGRVADDTPTDISCGSSASPTARTRLFVYWILLGREVDFLRQPLEFWLISYAIVRR